MTFLEFFSGLKFARIELNTSLVKLKNNKSSKKLQFVTFSYFLQKLTCEPCFKTKISVFRQPDTLKNLSFFAIRRHSNELYERLHKRLPNSLRPLSVCSELVMPSNNCEFKNVNASTQIPNFMTNFKNVNASTQTPNFMTNFKKR